VAPAALADTSRWLTRPDGWDHNGGEGPLNDRKLARLHFTASLATAAEAGLIKDREPLAKAAAAVAAAQEKDGSWLVVEDGTLGGATTHGNALATAMARRSLLHADARKYAKAIERADAWLRKLEVKSVLDAAAVLLALEAAGDAEANAQRRR